MPPFLSVPTPRLAARCTAALAAALIVALNLLAVCPEAHAWLHAPAHEAACACPHPAPAGHADEAPADADSGCIVSLFTKGKAADCIGLEPTVVVARPAVPVRFAVTTFRRHAADHRFPPGCGPPAA